MLRLKTFHLRYLSDECYQLIKDVDSVVEVNIIEDSKYKVGEDLLA